MRRTHESWSGESDIDCNTPKPASKAQRMTSESGENVPVKVPDKNINDVYKLLESIQRKQEDGRKALEKRIDQSLEKLKRDLSAQFNSALESAISTLRDDIDSDFQRFESDLSGCKQRLDEIEDQIRSAPAPAPFPPPGTIPGLPRSEFDTARNLIFKGIGEADDGENTENLLRSVEEIVSSLQTEGRIESEIRVLQAVRIKRNENNVIPGRAPVRHPRHAIVTLDSIDSRDTILHHKRLLRGIDSYKSIFIEPDKTRQQRIHEANMRFIVKSMPDLQFRGGRVLKKTR